MNKKNYALSICALLALAACSVVTESSGGDKSAARSSSAVSSAVCVSPSSNERDFLKTIKMGHYIYTWLDECGERRFYTAEGTSGDGSFRLTNPLTVRFRGEEREFSLSTKELHEIIHRHYVPTLDVFAVFEIPSLVDERAADEFEEHPVSFLSKDRSIYEELGIVESYDFVGGPGYDRLPEDGELSGGKVKSKADLAKYDAIYFDKYAVVNTAAKSHIYTLNGDGVASYESASLRYFDADRADEAVGLDFAGLVKLFGAPSYASGDLSVDYNIGKTMGYRFTFKRENNILIVESSEEIYAYLAMIDEGSARRVSASIFDGARDYQSINTIIRKYGRPTNYIDTTRAFGYILEDGSYATCRSMPWNETFDRGQLGYLVWDFKIQKEMPDRWN